MKLTLLVVSVFWVSTTCAQTPPYHFKLHKDALILLGKNEPADSVLQRLDGFLQHKREPVGQNPFVDPEYAKANLNPFENFFYPEFENGEDNFYKPTVLAVLPAKRYEQYVIKISYEGVTADKQAKLSLIGTLVVRKRKGNYFIYNAIDYNTRNWNTRQVGSVSYIYPNKLNLTRAWQMDKINHELARKFETKALPITYYRCDDPEQLLKMMGFDYLPGMYISMNGGFAQYWNNTVLAGNNSELYVHEVVHFYTLKYFEGLTRIMNEGYATYIGGSGGLSLKQLGPEAKNYIDQHPQTDIVKAYTGFERMDEGHIFTYAVSGLICKDIETRYGFGKIKELFKAHNDDDYFKTLQNITGIDRQHFADYVKHLANFN